MRKLEVLSNFDKGDIIFTIKNDKVFTGKVESFHYEYDGHEGKLKYWVRGNEDSYFVEENKAFASKEELINNL